MSFFGNIGNAIKKGVGDVAHTVGKVADNPLTKMLVAAGLAATGVGAPAAAGIMGTMGAGGALLKPGGNIGGAVKSGVTGAATGAAAGKVGQALYSGVGNVAGEGVLGTAANAARTGVGGLVDKAKSLGSSLGLTNGGNGTSGTSGTNGSEGGSSLLDKLLMAGTVAAGAMDEAHKRGLEGDARGYAMGAYDAKVPLRARALSLLQQDPVADPRLAAVSQDPGNVYDRARRARMLAATVTGAPAA